MEVLSGSLAVGRLCTHFQISRIAQRKHFVRLLALSHYLVVAMLRLNLILRYAAEIKQNFHNALYKNLFPELQIAHAGNYSYNESTLTKDTSSFIFGDFLWFAAPKSKVRPIVLIQSCCEYIVIVVFHDRFHLDVKEKSTADFTLSVWIGYSASVVEKRSCSTEFVQRRPKYVQCQKKIGRFTRNPWLIHKKTKTCPMWCER